MTGGGGPISSGPVVSPLVGVEEGDGVVEDGEGIASQKSGGQYGVLWLQLS